MIIEPQEGGSLTPFIYDTLTATQQAVLANYYDCKSMAVGSAIIGLVFIFLTIIFGISYLRSSKKEKTEDRAITTGLKMMGMICSFILSTALFITSVFYAARFYVASKTPVGAYQLKYGSTKKINDDKIYINLDAIDTTK